MRTLTLSGWGQPYDALQSIAPEAVHYDYASAHSANEIFAHLEAIGGQFERVIGWSLGGQLAARAVAAKQLRPRQLVLIAAPFQFVAQPPQMLGMKPDLFAQFRENLERDALRTLRKSHALVTKDDPPAQMLQPQDVAAQASNARWLHWLDALSGFSCDLLDFSDFPPTLLVHGGKDVVVHPDQSGAFAQKIPHAVLEYWPDAAHAPHWHNPAKLKAIMDAHAQ